jgi:hypothetical protein
MTEQELKFFPAFANNHASRNLFLYLRNKTVAIVGVGLFKSVLEGRRFLQNLPMNFTIICSKTSQKCKKKQ